MKIVNLTKVLNMIKDRNVYSDEQSTKDDHFTNIKSLDNKRRQLEDKCTIIIQELTSPPGPGIKPIGIDTPLVDSVGYPRGDIDLYHARNMRKKLAELQFDHKTIMKRIEQGLVSFGHSVSSNDVSTYG